MNEERKTMVEEQDFPFELNDLGVALWNWDPNSNKVSLSKEWKKIRGLAESTDISSYGELRFLVHPDDIDQLKRYRSELLAGKRSFYEYDHRVQHKNGSWVWIAERARAERDENGQVTKLHGCDIEITDRKHEEQRDRLSAIPQATSDFIGITDKEHKCIWRNKRLKNLRPNTQDIAIENAHPAWAVRIQVEEALPHAIEHGSWSGESAILDEKGNEIPVSQVVLAHKNACGEIECFSTIMRDISQQKSAEAALKESERMFASLAAASPVAIARLDAEGYSCNYVNQRWNELTGRPAETALGKNYWEFIHPDDSRAVCEKFDAFLQEESASVMDPMEVRHVIPGNDHGWVELHFAKVRNEKGDVEGVVGLISDIEESKRAERALRNLHERLHAVLETSSIGIWEWDRQNGLIWDDQMLTIHGLKRSDFRGVHEDWTNRLHPEDRDRLLSVEQRALQGKGSKALEYRIVRPDGEIRCLFANVYVETDEQGNVIRTSGINMDITERRKAEHALRKSESELQRISANAPGMIWKMEPVDDHYAITYLSSKSMEMFEVTPEEALSDANALRKYIHPDDLDTYLAGQEDAIKNLSSFSLEFRIELPEQGLRWRQCFAHPSKDATGIVVWHGMTIDITDRKTAELALQEAQARIQRITNNVPGMVYRYIVSPGRPVKFDYVSSESLAMFGVTPEELLNDGEQIKNWMHPDDVEELIVKRLDAAIATPQSVEYRVVTPDRGVRWYQSYCQPESLENGDVIWDGVVIDITNSKNVQIALQESQTQFERMTENVPGMIYRYVHPAEGKHQFAYVSQQVRELYEIEPEEALANADLLFTVVHPDDTDRFESASRHSASALTPFEEEFRVQLPKQGLRWRKAISQPSRASNGDTIWDGVVIDITEQKLTELELENANKELELATKMKDVFLANMSHELRTPLSAILSTTEGLQLEIWGPATPEQLESYAVIQQSGSHLLDVINEVLDLASIEAGTVRVEFSPVDLHALCKSCLRLVTDQAERKEIELSLGEFEFPAIQADMKRLRQILLNLLSNAIKFTPRKGKVSLDVTRVQPSEEGELDTIRFSVSDSGIGIEEANIHSIFEPFVQIESSLNRNYDGTGLGLALVKQFAELHGGTVQVTSTPGDGSCFSIDLPCRIASQSLSPTSRIDSKSTSKPKVMLNAPLAIDPGNRKDATPLILLAEDNELLAHTTRRFLESSNYVVNLVSNGKDAFENAQKISPDVILMDIQMPGMDGYEVIKKLRKLPGLSRIPIIALTGLAMQDDCNLCLKAGADHYLSKPYHVQDLVNLIEHVLHRDQRPQQA